MKLLVGLGNPGDKYLLTRHNLGFMLLDCLAGGERFQKKGHNLILKTIRGGETLIFAKPQTFMNLSGPAVQEILNFYKLPLENLLVIHDDKDLPFGSMKFQKSRGHGGHNGVRSIHETLKTQDYSRLKMGVAPAPAFESSSKNPELSKEAGTKTAESKEANTKTAGSKKLMIDPLNLQREDFNQNLKPIKDTSSYILSPFTKTEQKLLPDFLNKGLDAIDCWTQKGFEQASSLFNSNK